jgi:hypothetical protein
MPEYVVIDTANVLIVGFIVLDMILFYYFKASGDDYAEWWQVLLVCAVIMSCQVGITVGIASFIDWVLAAIIVGLATYFLFSSAAHSRWKREMAKKSELVELKRKLESNETHEERVARLLEEDDKRKIENRYGP